MCNEPERLACALHPVRETLEARGIPDGWGLAFFQGGEVLLQRHPKQPHGGNLDFYKYLKDLRTDYLVGVIGEAGTNKLENTQPYRFRGWVFAQSGKVAQFGAVQQELLDKIPDHLRRNIRGQNDSEHLFHLFLAFLHDANKLDDPNLRVTDAARALSGAVLMLDKMLEAAGAPAPSKLNLAVTNGRIQLFARRAGPMWMRRTNGVVDCQRCREHEPDPREERKRMTHEHLRSVLVVSEPAKLTGDGWEEIPDGSLVGVARDLTTSILPIRA
jgi:predicted glutamine amidotransferase